MKAYLRLGWVLLKRRFWKAVYRYSEKRYNYAVEQVISLTVKMEVAK